MAEDYFDSFDELNEIVGGTRVVNSKVVELLWYSVLYNSWHDEDEYKKIATGKKHRYDKFGNIAMVLYQLKYWADVKTKENKFKFDFHKSAAELEREMPWIGDRTMLGYLQLLDDIGVIKREQGKFKYSIKKYTYTLNYEHPVILAMYVYEALNRYVAQEKAKGTPGMVILNDPDYEQVSGFIENKSIRKLFPYHMEETDVSYVSNLHMVCKFLTYFTNTLLILYSYYTDPCESVPLSDTVNENEKEQEVGSPFKDTNTTDFFAGEHTEETCICSVSDLEEQALQKLNDMSSKDRNKTLNLNIGKWRKEERKGHYSSHDKREAAKVWFDSLDRASRDIVIEFQEAMYNGNGKISKEYSYNISIVDAYELAANFLQFVAEKHKPKKEEPKPKPKLDDEHDLPDDEEMLKYLGLTPNYNAAPVDI